MVYHDPFVKHQPLLPSCNHHLHPIEETLPCGENRKSLTKCCICNKEIPYYASMTSIANFNAFLTDNYSKDFNIGSTDQDY